MRLGDNEAFQTARRTAHVVNHMAAAFDGGTRETRPGKGRVRMLSR